jgi:hypothetical protein
MSNSTPNLIELRHHYENIIAQSEYQAAQAKEQLAHIDALLLNGLLQGETQTLTAVIAPDQPALPAALSSAPAPDNPTAQELAEDVEDFLARYKPSRKDKAKVTPAPEAATPGNRNPRPLLPAYQGLKRLEAIAQVLESTPGQEVSIDNLIPALFGTLSPADHQAERKRLKTLLYQGEKLKLWQKGIALSSYIIGVSETAKTSPTSPAVTAKATPAKAKAAIAPSGRDSLALLPAYEGMTKLEAISQILSEQSGHVLHQDTITQLLYGDLSPEVLQVESRRMRASLFQGLTKNLWQRASGQPSSYVAKASSNRKPNAISETPATPAASKAGRKPKSTAKANAPTKTASRGRTQVLSLPAQYAGLSKIETVAKVLEQNNGKVMHIDEIIEQLYGKLSGETLKAEKVRMKDVMTRGVQRKLWNKAQGVTSSIVAGEPNQSSAPNTKSPTGKVAQLNPATAKKPRKAVPAKPKRKKAEVIALLKKANIKV